MVGADEGCSRVEPFHHEHVPVLSHQLQYNINRTSQTVPSIIDKDRKGERGGRSEGLRGIPRSYLVYRVEYWLGMFVGFVDGGHGGLDRFGGTLFLGTEQFESLSILTGSDLRPVFVFQFATSNSRTAYLFRRVE